MSNYILSPKVAKEAVKEYILQQKLANKSVVEAAHISTKLDIPYKTVKEIFHELVAEGYLSSLEDIPA